MQQEQGKDAGLPLLAACHHRLCNRESTASSETPLTNSPESCVSSTLAKAGVTRVLAPALPLGLEPGVQITSPHSAERHAKLELEPVLNKCLLLALDCHHYLHKHPRMAL